MACPASYGSENNTVRMCYVSIRQHTSANGLLSVRQHTSAYVLQLSIRQHTSAAAKTPQDRYLCTRVGCTRHTYQVRTSAYDSIRQHSSAYASHESENTTVTCVLVLYAREYTHTVVCVTKLTQISNMRH